MYCSDRTSDFIGKGCLGRKQQGKETKADSSARRLAVLGFMVMGLVSRLSLGNHSDSGALPMCMSPSTNDSRRKILGSSLDIRIGISFLSLTFPKFLQLMVAC